MAVAFMTDDAPDQQLARSCRDAQSSLHLPDGGDMSINWVNLAAIALAQKFSHNFLLCRELRINYVKRRSCRNCRCAMGHGQMPRKHRLFLTNRGLRSDCT